LQFVAFGESRGAVVWSPWATSLAWLSPVSSVGSWASRYPATRAAVSRSPGCPFPPCCWDGSWGHSLSSVIFFNLGAVAIEGAYFVPGLVPLPIPVLLVQQALAAAGAALAIMVLFAAPGQPISWWTALRQRPWHAWVWRFAVSAGSYVVLYYAFGALNYALVTQPYYASHAGGLSTPPPGQVIVAELVRAPLLMLSVLLFLLSARMPRRRLMVVTGMLLFAIGGIVPLVMQISSLPMLLLAASTVEIFCQNFGAGLVAADLLGARS
jgi:hypothetical protein